MSPEEQDLRIEDEALRLALKDLHAVHGHNVKLKAKLEASELNERTEACNAEALRSEVDRLRAELVEAREVAVRNATDCQHLRQSAIALTDSLAAANALLANTSGRNWSARRWAHLAAQPATARCACQYEAGDSECKAHPCPHRWSTGDPADVVCLDCGLENDEGIPGNNTPGDDIADCLGYSG